jgi:hypothetical protein
VKLSKLVVLKNVNVDEEEYKEIILSLQTNSFCCIFANRKTE